MKNPKILMIAGEASGDNLGAEVVSSLYQLSPDIQISAIGGKAIQAAGAEILMDSKELAVMGIWEVLTHARIIRKAYNRVKQYLTEEKPDVVILVDYPGFNLRIAKLAKSLDCKVLYYVSPKIWASRYGRIHMIRQSVDHMVVFFKFEEELYQKEGVPVSLVAHPLEILTQKPVDTDAILKELGLDPSAPIIALLPGSRKSEIKNHLPILIESQKFIQQSIQNAQFVIPLASTIDQSQIQPQLGPNIKLTTHKAYEIFKLSQAAVIASGTATLEAALSKVPMVIIYKILGFHIVKHFVKIPYAGLCNIAAKKFIAPEFLQENAKPQVIADEIIKLVRDLEYRKKILKEYDLVPLALGQEEPGPKVAKLVLGMV